MFLRRHLHGGHALALVDILDRADRVIVFFEWGRQDDRRRSPHEVLKRRLANGDISAEEYEQRKLLLDRDAGPRPEYGAT
jgi:uncharacterized membrane protein